MANTTEFFSAFPYITNQNNQMMKNITIRLEFIKNIVDNVALFQQYQVMTGQRVEDVARLFYGDPNLAWIILYINEMVDPYYDWLLTDNELMAFVQNKYGVENVYATKWNVAIAGSNLPLGTPCNFGTPFSQALTNFAYEQNINEGKRKIKILNTQYLSQVMSEYFTELQNISS